jgi:SNF2 family DNA or RNA helicase
LRNRKTVRSKNILKVRAKAKYALALSGTPAVNGSLDILKIFQFLFPQENYGSRYYYKKKFFHSEKNSKNQKI